jgi:hypothetical protein
MIGKELLMIGGKAGFRFPTWKKQGKSWLPITMIGNFGNIISSPVRIQIYHYMYRKGLHSYSRSIGLMTLHSTPCIFCILVFTNKIKVSWNYLNKPHHIYIMQFSLRKSRIKITSLTLTWKLESWRFNGQQSIRFPTHSIDFLLIL